MAVRKAAGLLGGGNNLPETFGYSVKRRLLGPPLVNEQLGEERLSVPLALGVLSPDGISSSAYGTEEILIELLKSGLLIAAFTVLLPITGVVLFVLALVVLSYREVVTVYTRTGGSYVVARDNFGPRVAQIAAVALLIDYTVTVAVQTAAGAAAIVSAFPALSTLHFISAQDVLLIISVAAILIMCYGNLRGIREAGRAFALPTYLFSGSVGLMILVGLAREAFGHLPVIDVATLPPRQTYYDYHDNKMSLLISGALVLTLLRAFANGGSSLTGIEAVSNAVSALKPPEGPNARKVLVTQGVILAFLVGGISWLAHVQHATPYIVGTPTVLSQEASLIFGGGAGKILFYFVQFATALILFTGGNTSFNGFPFLASFVAQDAFLPRWLTKRGHRLVFSNGIIVLTVVSLALLLAVGANVNNLVPFYAIGVFTGFSMAGFGMSKYHLRHKERGWRRRLVINFSAGVLTGFIVLIFAVTKFTEGAWLVVVVGPIGVFILIRLNREYRSEDQVLENIGDRRAAGMAPRQPNYTRRTVLRVRGQHGPGHAGRPALRAQPAPDLAACGALRHRQCPRGTAAGAVGAFRAGRAVRDDRHAGPQARACLTGTGAARGRAAGHPGHRGAAAAQFRPPHRPAAARPDRRQDRRGGQPDPQCGRDDHPVRRGKPGPGAGGAAGHPGREGQRDHGRRRNAGTARRPGGQQSAASAPAGRPPESTGQHPAPARPEPAAAAPDGASAPPEGQGGGRGGQAHRLAAGGGQGDGGRARDVPGDPAGGAELRAGPGDSR